MAKSKSKDKRPEPIKKRVDIDSLASIISGEALILLGNDGEPTIELMLDQGELDDQNLEERLDELRNTLEWNGKFDEEE